METKIKKDFKVQSIKTKLNLTLISVIIIMFFIIIIPVFIGYEGYYISQQKDFLMSSYSQIDKNLGSIESFKSQLMIIESKESINTIILDSDENIIYSTTQLLNNLNYKDIYKLENGFNLNTTNLKNNPNSYITIETINNFSNVESLQLVTSLTIDNQIYYIVLEKTMTNINSIVAGIVIFLFMCIIPMSLISSLIVSKVSNFIISPIIELSEISELMASFQFDTPVNIRTNDEIGILAKNIQLLSTELKLKLDELNTQNKLLEENIKEKDKNSKIQREFISNVSHELRTPITLILGYSEALKLDLDEKTKQEYMEIIIAESHKMSNLISDMLDISRLQSGDKQLSKEKFSFSKLLNDIIQKHQITFTNNKLDISVNIMDNCNIYGDKSKLELVISNFIVNAVRYVDSNKKIKVDLVEENNKYIFKIFNTANQFSDEDIKKIWGSFYKIDKAHSREKGGTGIGLYLVKTILELHDFNYGVNNKDNGVEFFIEIEKESNEKDESL